MSLVTKRRIGIAVLAVVAMLALLFPWWKENSNRGGQLPAEPFRIAGNLYYVGANDATAFLVTGPEGHLLIDGGYPGTAPMIVESITKLGFDIADVEVLLNSDPHSDHAGGLAALQRASGAKVLASEASAYSLRTGGDDPDIFLPLRLLLRARIIGFPSVRVDGAIKDAETIRVGPVAVTAHITGGHTRGCTSYSFTVQDGDRTLNVVSACSLVVLGVLRYPEQQADLTRTFSVLRGLPVDIWVTSHARLWNRYQKFVASDTAADPVAAFIDPAGYRAYVDSAEARLRRGQVQ